MTGAAQPRSTFPSRLSRCDVAHLSRRSARTKQGNPGTTAGYLHLSRWSRHRRREPALGPGRQLRHQVLRRRRLARHPAYGLRRHRAGGRHHAARLCPPERVALVDDWGSMFDAPCVGTSNCPSVPPRVPPRRPVGHDGHVPVAARPFRLWRTTRSPDSVGLTRPLDGITVTSDFTDSGPVRRKCAIGGAQAMRKFATTPDSLRRPQRQHPRGSAPSVRARDLTQPQAYPLPVSAFGRSGRQQPCGREFAPSAPLGPYPASPAWCLRGAAGQRARLRFHQQPDQPGFYLGVTLR